jgi:hypothetical protein
MKALVTIGTWLLLLLPGRTVAQCTNYTIAVGGGLFDSEITWQLETSGGTVVASGAAPQTVGVCLPDGCYTMYMFDSFGDGWNGASFTVRVQPSNTIVASGTLSNGFTGQVLVSLGTGCGGSGCSSYTLNVTAGAYPAEVSWNLVSGTLIVATGFAPGSVVVCLAPGCYVMQLFDSFGDGWNGATWTLVNNLGATVQSGTLSTGSIGQAVIPLGVAPGSCTSSGPVTASDCAQAVNICTNYSFQVDPNGTGAVNEIPPLGSLGNPDLLLGDLAYSTWGSDNWGCLRNNELNSTWMIVNVSGGGSLEFTFGGLGTQAGFYDWIMYPYSPGTCASIVANTLPPVRCNWNNTSTGGTGLASTLPPGGDPGNFEPPLVVTAGQQYVICFSNWSSVTTLVPLEFGGTATVSCNPVVLPVGLLDLDAVPHAAAIQLEWSTATEDNSARFVVEHASDPWSWTEVGSLPAAGSSGTTTHYRFLHEGPVEGQQYYRLRIEDQDGSAAYSPIVEARWLRPGPLVHPNPAQGRFTVDAAGPVHVIDAQGRTVPVQRTLTGTGRSEVRLPEASRGLYTVIAGTGASRRCERVVIE